MMMMICTSIGTGICSAISFLARTLVSFLSLKNPVKSSNEAMSPVGTGRAGRQHLDIDRTLEIHGAANTKQIQEDSAL